MLSSSQVASLRLGLGVCSFKGSCRGNGEYMRQRTPGSCISVSCVAPGPIAMEMYFAEKTEEQIQSIVAECSLGQLGELMDIAPVVGFLATDASEWVNG